MTHAPQVSLQVEKVQREDFPVDVLIVGAGPAGLACAIELRRRLDARGMGDKTVLVLEKAQEVGYHILSGAVMDPRGMQELFPDWRERGCPIEADVTGDCMEVLRPGGKSNVLRGKLMPPPLHNEGNSIISLYQVVRWMKDQAESLGAQVFPGFAAAKVLFDAENPNRVVGVETRDAGIDKHGEPKGSFQPGMNIRAAVTIFAEGTRGSSAKYLIERLGLAPEGHPQIYATGIKEIWEIPAERGSSLKGQVIHTLGEPLSPAGFGGYGGGWIYGLSGNRLSIGFVVGLDHHDANLDPHALFVAWKSHPAVAARLAGGKVLRYGAKTIPEGGYFAMPRLQGDGFCLVGDSGGFLNAARLKGVHLAIKSGLLAAEAVVEALAKNDTSAASLARYTELFEASWARQELWRVRNFRQAFDHGFLAGVLDAGVQMVTQGRGFIARRKSHADHTTTRTLARAGGKSRHPRPAHNDTSAMDKLTDVYWSGTIHEEDQPAHLLVTDPSICVSRCTEEYGNPCRHFCPAAVYEWPEGRGKDGSSASAGPVINFSNCVHCKTCDIADPYQVIQWVVPEGGGGPKYIDM
ncbi:MAG: electron transfer flavoprotein-ubiquinone oxidoreductase [Planctomycetes bacterium]|nr:electron transfer flavoprotein-ubiquinone oxidoreductase [Planctomycetota bacterium]